MNEQFRTTFEPLPKKQRSRTKLILVSLVMLVAAAGGIAYWTGLTGGNRGGKPTASKSEKYTCGMHPWIISDKPGDCPICGMKLTKIEDQPSATIESGKSSQEAEDFFSGKPAAKTIEGLATVRVAEEALKLSGLQTSQAARESLSRSIRTVGIVVADETRVRHIHTKIEGWVEKLFINFMGQMVKKGEPTLSIYAPELLASQEEYLRARDTEAKFHKSESPEVRKLGEDILKSARKRLELFDVPSGFIEEIARTGKVQRAVTLVAPITGFVTGKEIFEGQKVEPGMNLFNVTDLSHIWIEADLYEYEAGAVKAGQPADLMLTYEPGKELKGKVTYVLPYLSPESRTLKVRFEFQNPDFALKPQMYADVKLNLDTAEGITIPDSALIDTGLRRVVFVETSPGTFEPREVRIGVRGEGKVQILSGVQEGEKVVVKANFLLDSESRLRAALNKMTGPAPQQKAEQKGGTHASGGHGG